MNLSKAIIKTLTYHDIFDYPLTKEELLTYLIEHKTTGKKLEDQLPTLIKSKKIGETGGYFHLPKRKDTVAVRKSRLKTSKLKQKKAIFYTKVLRAIPTLKFVAISGALAMENSPKSDDIDLMLITSKSNLWSTRLLANLFLFKYKRNPKAKKAKDKACLNIFLDESSLKIENQNIYTAHEICQIKPILDSQGTYSKLIRKNKWVFKYLPNWQPDLSLLQIQSSKKTRRFIKSNLAPFEILAKKFQLYYMSKKITTEKIGEHQLFFHPEDTEHWVINEYNKRLKSTKIKN